MPRPDTRHKGINLDRAREMIASGWNVAEAARALGCSRPNLVQRLAVARTRIAAAEETGRTATRHANAQAKSGRGRDGGQGNVHTAH